jgi:hypothetical protein
MRNWSVYIKTLREYWADEKVVLILDQIKDLHRNPIIDPEQRLTNDEALSLIGIMDSAVTAIIADMKERRERVRRFLSLCRLLPCLKHLDWRSVYVSISPTLLVRAILSASHALISQPKPNAEPRFITRFAC